MGAALGTYGVVYRRVTESGSPPVAWDVSLTEFQFGIVDDFDVDVVRGAGFVSLKTTTALIIDAPQVSRDGVQEIRIICRRAMLLWDDIA